MRSLLYSLLLVAASLPVLVYGQGKVYSPLVNIPGNGANGFEEYISFLYGASISVAALLAVVKIIIAGAKYMMSDVITNKGEALSDIQGAILGLLLILGAVIILEFINPQLIKREIKFQTIAPPPTINARSSVTPASGLSAGEYAQSLMQGADACLQSSGPPVTSSDGNRTVVAVSASACPPDQRIPQLTIFENNCERDGGTISSPGTGSNILVCESPTQGGIAPAQLAAARTELSYIKSTFGFTADPDGDGIRTTYTLPNEYIKLEGTKIIVESKRYCEDTFSVSKTPNLSVGQRIDVLEGCLTHNWGASRCQFINDGNNKDAEVTTGGFTCSMPRQIQAALDLRINHEAAGGTWPPRTYAEAVRACGTSNELIKTRGPGSQWSDYVVNLEHYDCFRY